MSDLSNQTGDEHGNRPPRPARARGQADKGVSRLAATRKPAWAIVYLKGFPHLLHLRALRRALLDRAIVGEDHAIMDVAKKLGISRSTLSRLFSGRNVSIDMLRPVLLKLGLEFERVCFPLEGELLERLVRDGTIERNGTTLLTVDPLSLPDAATLRPDSSSRPPARRASPWERALPDSAITETIGGRTAASGRRRSMRRASPPRLSTSQKLAAHVRAGGRPAAGRHPLLVRRAGMATGAPSKPWRAGSWPGCTMTAAIWPTSCAR